MAHEPMVLTSTFLPRKACSSRLFRGETKLLGGVNGRSDGILAGGNAHWWRRAPKEGHVPPLLHPRQILLCCSTPEMFGLEKWELHEISRAGMHGKPHAAGDSSYY